MDPHDTHLGDGALLRTHLARADSHTPAPRTADQDSRAGNRFRRDPFDASHAPTAQSKGWPSTRGCR
jgi:hypothetical protein